MKPAPFEYYDPRSVDEALALLQEHGDEAKVLAGGQSLGPLLNMRMATPQVIVDVNRVEALDYQQDQDGWMAIGALTRQSELEDDASFHRKQPLVAEAIPLIGHRAIRNQGTVGGSVAHADPAAEWPALVAGLDAELVVQSAGNDPRVLGAEDFFLTYLTTMLQPDELLLEIRLPPWPKDAGWAFVEFSRRHGDFALVGVASRLRLDPDRICRDARLALIGVEGVPVRARQAEDMLEGERVSRELFVAAGQETGKNLDPQGDLHASGEFRRDLAGVLVRRALTQAAKRCEAGIS